MVAFKTARFAPLPWSFQHCSMVLRHKQRGHAMACMLPGPISACISHCVSF